MPPAPPRAPLRSVCWPSWRRRWAVELGTECRRWAVELGTICTQPWARSGSNFLPFAVISGWRPRSRGCQKVHDFGSLVPGIARVVSGSNYFPSSSLFTTRASPSSVAVGSLAFGGVRSALRRRCVWGCYGRYNTLGVAFCVASALRRCGRFAALGGFRSALGGVALARSGWYTQPHSRSLRVVVGVACRFAAFGGVQLC